MKIRRLLIANRGEIALRIIKTAKKMGIFTLAIYAEPDQNALHCLAADKAVPLCGKTSQETYLSFEKILKIAKDNLIDAIHPGYGFLSENADFASACERDNIIFIGPKPFALKAMGLKADSKQYLAKTKVPLIPGYHEGSQSIDDFKKAADKIGYPVLLKASAGGGGKGMRLVENPEKLAQAFNIAQEEAHSSFGDKHLILEKYLQSARHIEAQIIADQHGKVLHLFERDCSIQRRHQKIIEEAPAFNLSPHLRQALCTAAVEVAKAVDYLGVGTVEFLVEGDDFYFMEMNTRLQVEHPITEMITGLDLVEWQIRIAEGEPLPWQQEEIKAQGHAIELRLCAEKPFQDFLPSLGILSYCDFPDETPFFRTDLGIQKNSIISSYFDPLLGKLIGYGDDRAMALENLKTKIKAIRLIGVENNLNYLRQIVETEDFIKGKIDTHFIQKHNHLILEKKPGPFEFALIALFERLKPQDNLSAWADRSGFQINHTPHRYDFFFSQEQCIETCCEEKDNKFKITVANETPFIFTKAILKNETLFFEKENNSQTVCIQEQKSGYFLFGLTQSYFIEKWDPQKIYGAREEIAGHLQAPMPGTVVAIFVNLEEEIEAGASLMVIEAMKMQHTIYAPKKGKIKTIFFQIGDQVNEGSQLLTIEG